MKRLALLTLLLGLTGPALSATEPCPDAYGNAAYPEQFVAPTEAHQDGDVERARAAMAAGQDLNVALAATAAGPAYDQHPYVNGGHFGAERSANCE